jgi:ATP-dependent Clp protease ATP-binding subunit ClpC
MTPAARTVLGLASAEAKERNDDCVGTEHILLGLMGEADSDAARILAAHTDLGSLGAQLDQLAGEGAASAGDEPRLSVRARVLLHFARREADMYGQEHVAPVHLLLGMLREGEGAAMQALLKLHVDVLAVRADASRSAGPLSTDPSIPPPDEAPED